MTRSSQFLAHDAVEFAALCKAWLLQMWQRLATADTRTRREIQTRKHAREAVLHLDRP